jgi:cytoskeletal protein CcmA (bactofilin family)
MVRRAVLMETSKTAEFANIGKSVVIKGEVSGSEDLYVDGQVEGSVELAGNNLTVGPNGLVHANVNAKCVVVQGKLEGNIRTTDRVDLRKSAVVMGDILTQRIAIEDGAYFKGKVEIQKEPAKTEVKSEPKREAGLASSAAATLSSSANATGSSAAGFGNPKPALAEQKK